MARIKNMNTCDEPIEVLKRESHHKDALTYRHPSYGMIKMTRRTCNLEVPQFGAKHPSSNIISITISKAQNTQSLSQNWYYAYETVTEVEMTPVQYAEFISNPNTEGVPCTIKYTRDDGRIVYKPHATEVEYLETKIKSDLEGLSDKLQDKKDRAKELLTQKGTLKKADKEELLRIVQCMETEMSSTIPWYKERMAKSLDKMVMEANSDIESLVTNVQTKLGKALIERPEAIELLLEDKRDD